MSTCYPSIEENEARSRIHKARGGLDDNVRTRFGGVIQVYPQGVGSESSTSEKKPLTWKLRFDINVWFDLEHWSSYCVSWRKEKRERCVDIQKWPDSVAGARVC